MALHEITSYDSFKALKDSTAELLVMMHHTGSLASRTVYNSMKSLAESGVEVAVIDVQKHGLTSQLHVTTVPTVIGFAGGKEMNRSVGIQTESVYRNLIQPKKAVMVKLFKTPTCPWCNVAKQHLDKKGVSYTEIDVSQDYVAAQYLMKKSGQTGVPQIEIGDEIVVGADVNRIDQLLAQL